MSRRDLAIAIVVAVLIIGAVGYAFYRIGSPVVISEKKLDARRFSDFQSLSNSVNSYYASHGALPPSLAEVSSSEYYYGQPVNDPSTGMPYDYATVSATSYKLCANFSDPNDLSQTFASSTEYYYGQPKPALEASGPGSYACLVFTVPVNRYPTVYPYPGNPPKLIVPPVPAPVPAPKTVPYNGS